MHKLLHKCLVLVEATGICRFRFAEPRQDIVMPTTFVFFLTDVYGHHSREPTVIRVFREARHRNKKITDDRLAIRYFWLNSLYLS